MDKNAERLATFIKTFDLSKSDVISMMGMPKTKRSNINNWLTMGCPDWVPRMCDLLERELSGIIGKRKTVRENTTNQIIRDLVKELQAEAEQSQDKDEKEIYQKIISRLKKFKLKPSK